MRVPTLLAPGHAVIGVRWNRHFGTLKQFPELFVQVKRRINRLGTKRCSRICRLPAKTYLIRLAKRSAKRELYWT